MIRFRRALLAGMVLLVAFTASAAALDPRFVVRVTPEMLRHQHILDTMYFAGTAYEILVLSVILVSGLARRLRDAAERSIRWRFAQSMLFFILLSLVTTVVELPIDVYRGFVVPHEFALTHQTFAAWLGDLAKGLAVDLAIGSVLAALVLLAMRRVRQWWVVVWACSLPLVVAGVVATPLIIDPLFNDFRPLHDQVLKRDLIAEASRAGIDAARVYEVDKSKQTTTMNAYVTGLGPSKRIVLWDTLLAKLTHDEILAVMGHEMGHYVLHHIWKGIAFEAAVTFLGFALAQWLFERGLARWGSRWGMGERGDPASLPWLLLLASVLAFLFSPVYSSFSRHIEHQADQFALELTHLNEAAATSEVKFAEDSKVDPSPNRFIEFWRYSHPAAQRRIEFALEYRPWEQGKGNELWVPSK
jgi:Zn-dependent protease with chaperone function